MSPIAEMVKPGFDPTDAVELLMLIVSASEASRLAMDVTVEPLLFRVIVSTESMISCWIIDFDVLTVIASNQLHLCTRELCRRHRCHHLRL